MKVNVEDKEREVKVLPHVKNLGGESTVRKMEAVIEKPEMQVLQKLRPFLSACLRIPGDMSMEGQDTLKRLFSCFEKQGDVQEGKVGDLIWGFQQHGVHEAVTISGLKEMETKGYIRLQSPDNAYTGFHSENVIHAFVRYQKKLTDMVYEPLDNNKV